MCSISNHLNPRLEAVQKAKLVPGKRVMKGGVQQIIAAQTKSPEMEDIRKRNTDKTDENPGMPGT